MSSTNPQSQTTVGTRGDRPLTPIIVTAGDTEPALECQLRTGGEPYDLSGEEIRGVEFHLRGSRSGRGQPLIARRAEIVDGEAEDGWVRFQWRRGETRVPGIYRGRFIVKKRGGDELSFPNQGRLTVLFTDS